MHTYSIRHYAKENNEAGKHRSFSFLRHTCKLFIIFTLALLGCKEDEFKPFDDQKTAFATGNPHLRVFNIHSKKDKVTIKIGGKVYKEDLLRYELTAFQEMTSELLGDSVLEVYDSEGRLLRRERLSVEFGVNYTYVIIPKYYKVPTLWKIETSIPLRYMIKATDTASVGIMLESTASRLLADRTSVRLACLAIDQSLHYASSLDPYGGYIYALTFYNSVFSGGRDTRQFTLLTYNNTEYDKTNPPEWQLSKYYVWRNGNQTTIQSYASDQTGTNDKPWITGFPTASETAPYDFQLGKSYTIITNGTQGVINDSSMPTAEALEVPLEPIPYEMFFLDETNGEGRMLYPVEQYTGTKISSAEIILQHHSPGNYKNVIVPAVGNEPLNVPTGYFDYSPSSSFSGWLSNYSVPVTLTGNRTVSAVPYASSTPTLASFGPIEIKKGAFYSTHYYEDEKAIGKLKVVEEAPLYKPGLTRVRLVHLSPDLGEIKVVDSTTNNVLIPSLKFEDLSQYVELSNTNATVKLIRLSDDVEVWKIKLNNYQDISLSISGYRQPDIDNPVYPENRLRVRGTYFHFPLPEEQPKTTNADSGDPQPYKVTKEFNP